MRVAYHDGHLRVDLLSQPWPSAVEDSDDAPVRLYPARAILSGTENVIMIGEFIMNGQVQYVTDTEGKQVGVLLDIDLYRALVSSEDTDPELLTNLSEDELKALAESQLSPARQARLDELISRQREETLSEEESAELDTLLAQVDQLTTLKTRARYTLQHHQSPAR